MGGVKTIVGVCAASMRLVDNLVEALRDVDDVEVTPILGSDELSSVSSRLHALVLVNGRERLDHEFMSELQALGDRVPLVVFGGEAASMGGVACWLPSVPPRAVLAALLHELVRTGPRRSWSSCGEGEGGEEEEVRSQRRRWRRKDDMIVGQSRATKHLLHELTRVAPSSASVTILGESGTGKELVARALHFSGPRAEAPFIAINCAAIPETLVEAELFGYQRGAFTGAMATRLGAFEAAERGTIFLDEIGEMPRAIQPKLLRVLERSEIVRLGSNDPRPVHARVITASNRDLREEVRAGRFREDLFYRLDGYTIRLEPLRHRPDDLPALVSHHITLLAARENRTVPRILPGALERLLGYNWPGNVRELVHVLVRALLTCSDNVIGPEHIDLPSSGAGVVDRYRDAKQRFEIDYYARLMRAANGNVALAARLADKTRKEVYDALKRAGIDAVEYRHGTLSE